jgi:3',5'-cyclic-AMP phosphodiesterase
MVIAQISDMHVRPRGQLAYGRVDTASFLDRCVEQLRRMTPPPDIVLATGDLVDAGDPAEYQHLRDLLTPLWMPVYLIPGNHDNREALVREFSDHAYLPRAGFMQYVLDEYPVRLIALDTLVPGKTGGLLCAERLAWLAARLEEARARPTVIFMHHAPFLTGIAHMDRVGLQGSDALGEVVQQHPQIERVLCGHLHRLIQLRWHGTLVSTAPSTAHQVSLDFREESPATFVLEPPGFLIHLWRKETGLVTHLSYVGEFAGPYPFHD